MEKIKTLLEPYIDLPLECDGLTKVLSHILTKNDIEHIVHEGFLTGPRDGIWHTWIELPNGYYVDYRARMWQGESRIIPHGIFRPQLFTAVTYSINETMLLSVPDTIFEILTFKPPAHEHFN